MNIETMNTDTVAGPVSEQSNATEFTDRQKRDELAREINLRKAVYPGMVRARRMTHEESEQRQAILTAIWQDYSAKVVHADSRQTDATPISSNSPSELSGNDAAVGVATAMTMPQAELPTPSTPSESARPQTTIHPDHGETQTVNAEDHNSQLRTTVHLDRPEDESKQNDD